MHKSWCKLLSLGELGRALFLLTWPGYGAVSFIYELRSQATPRCYLAAVEKCSCKITSGSHLGTRLSFIYVLNGDQYMYDMFTYKRISLSVTSSIKVSVWSVLSSTDKLYK